MSWVSQTLRVTEATRVGSCDLSPALSLFTDRSTQLLSLMLHLQSSWSFGCPYCDNRGGGAGRPLFPWALHCGWGQRVKPATLPATGAIFHSPCQAQEQESSSTLLIPPQGPPVSV
jgi:hypothetical protein